MYFNNTTTAVIHQWSIYNSTVSDMVNITRGEERENFNKVVLKFGLSILIVGCLLLLALIIIFLLGLSRKRIQKALDVRSAAREFNYDNHVDILDEDANDSTSGVARNGVLVISPPCEDPKERLASADKTHHGYEATSMAKYVERNHLPQAIV